MPHNQLTSALACKQQSGPHSCIRLRWQTQRSFCNWSLTSPVRPKRWLDSKVLAYSPYSTFQMNFTVPANTKEKNVSRLSPRAHALQNCCTDLCQRGVSMRGRIGKTRRQFVRHFAASLGSKCSEWTAEEWISALMDDVPRRSPRNRLKPTNSSSQSHEEKKHSINTNYDDSRRLSWSYSLRHSLLKFYVVMRYWNLW